MGHRQFCDRDVTVFAIYGYRYIKWIYGFISQVLVRLISLFVAIDCVLYTIQSRLRAVFLLLENP